MTANTTSSGVLVAAVAVVLAGLAPASAVAAAGAAPSGQAGPPGELGGPAAGAWAGAGAAATGQANCSFPVSVVDATGTEVTVAERPERITVLGPSAAQTLWEIGARERVVGLPHQYAGYLEGVENRTDVSGPGQSYVGNEKVVNTSPDLVLAPNVIQNSTVSKLRDAGLTVYRFRAAGDIQDVYAKTNLTGRLVGECDGAAETVAWMRSELGVVREAVAGEPRPRVLVSMGGGFTAGNGTFIHEIVQAAGGQNVAAQAGITGYKEISGETVVERDPEWIVRNGQFGTVPNTAAYNSTTAVREGQVFTVNASYASQPAPRLVLAVVEIATHLHPEAYAAANQTTTTTETTATRTTTAGTTTDGTTTTTTTETETGGQPGFGPGAGLAAFVLAGSALLGRR